MPRVIGAAFIAVAFLIACEGEQQAGPPPAMPPPPPPPPVAIAPHPSPDTFEPDYYQACDSPSTIATCRTLLEKVTAEAALCKSGCDSQKERVTKVHGRVEQLEKMLGIQQEGVRRQAETTEANAAAARALQERLAKERAEAQWKLAPERCVQELNDGVCAEANPTVSDAQRDDCRRYCEGRTSDWIREHVDAALKACYAAYDGGDRQAACKVDLPSTAVESRRSRVNDLLTDCSKTCSKEAPEFVRAKKAGAGLVANYKQCMSTVLNSAAARKMKGSDDAAYNDLFGRTDVRCRPLGRCDWVEKYTELQCSFTAN